MNSMVVLNRNFIKKYCWFILFFVFPLLLSAQCPVLIGGSDFEDIGSSDTLWNGTFSLTKQKGPTGNSFLSDFPHADSAQMFYEDLALYAITSNPHLLDSTYIDIDKNMCVIKTKYDDVKNAMFKYRINGLQPGTAFNIKMKIYNVIDPNKSSCSFLEWQSGIRLVSKIDQYGNVPENSISESIKLGAPGSDFIDVNLSGTLPVTDNFLEFSILPDYNLSKCAAFGITDLEVYGCYKPKVKSTMGINICQGEQNLFYLDREYNASSYEWMKSTDNGASWTSVGSSKNLLEEVHEPIVMYYCLVDGVESDTISITSSKCCEDEFGNPMSKLTVFYENFGSFKDGHTYVDADGVETQTPANWIETRADTRFTMPAAQKFDPTGQINDGSYGVVVPTSMGYKTDWWATWMTGVTSDHTSTVGGEENGACLFMNVSEGFHDVIFSTSIDGLCTNKPLFFETFIANMSGGSDPEITLNIKDSKTGNIIESATAVALAGNGWIRVNIDELLLDENVTSVILEVVATGTEDLDYDYSGCNDSGHPNKYWKCGNDLAIDDIKFSVCSPPNVDLYSNLSSFARDTTICGDTDITVGTVTSSLLESFYKNSPKFLYQQSSDGENWVNMKVVTDKEFTFNTADYPADTNYIRLVVTSESGVNKFIENPSAADFDNPCRDYSISKPFKIIRAGSIDLGKNYSGSACKNEKVTLKGVSTPTISSWHWADSHDNKLTTSSELDFSFDLVSDTTFYFVGYSADGCVGKRKYEVDVNPTAEVQLLLDMYCDSTVVSYSATPANATLDWVLDGVAYTPSSPIVFKQADMGAKLSVVASAAGYCESLPAEEVIAVKQSPVAPTTLDIDLVATPNKSISLDTAATADAGCSLLWYGNGSVYTSTAATATPSLSIAQEGTFYYWVTQVNADNCESDTVRVTVTVNDAPLPTTRDTIVCVGESVNLSDLATPENNTDYTLNWYIDNNVQKETSVPIVDVSIPTMRTFYVSQTNKAAAIPIESKKKKIVVEIFAVQKPTKPADIQLCYGDNAPVLSYTNEAYPSHYLGADATVWYENGVALNAVPVISTAVQQTTTTTYSIGQTYTIPTSGSVCVGDTTSFNVTVTVVQVPSGSFNVGYVRSEAANNNGVFADNLTTKDATVAVPDQGCQLLWYDENKNLIGNGLTAPTPVYDANWPVGQEMKFSYYVAQQNIATGCVSELKEVEVVISDSPKPKVTPLDYCVGNEPKSTSFADDLLASATPDMTINPQGNYKLLWFSSADEYKTNPTAGVEIPVLVPSTQTAGTQVFYVCQYDISSNAMSFPSTVLVTVYANPILTPQSTTQVCNLDGAGATVDLKEGYKTDIVTTAEFFSDASAQNPVSATVNSSDTYYARGYYSPVVGLTCYSSIEPIVATIYDLNTPIITAQSTACPETKVPLSALAASSNPGAASVTYSWTASDGSSFTGSSIMSNTMPLNPDEFVTFTVTASVATCHLSASKTIVVGDAPISGEVSIVEADRQTPFMIAKQSGSEIYTCGGKLSMSATMTKTAGDYVWFKDGAKIGTGDYVELDLPEGDASIRIEFTNECPTFMEFVVHSIPVNVTPDGTNVVELCEDEKFETGFSFSSKEAPTIEWYRDNVLIPNATQSKFTIDAVKNSDDGVYSFIVKNSACEAKGNAHTLNAKPYIDVTKFTDPFIVRRNGSQVIDLDINVPANQVVQSIQWLENGVSVGSGNSLTVNSVLADHSYHVKLSDPDYCDASLDILVWVDAEIQLATQLKDTLCIGSSAVMVIDTTGTGAFRQPGVIPSLKVTSTINGVVSDLTSLLQNVDDMLHLTVTPDAIASYRVDFVYGNQQNSSIEDVVVIPAITLVIPPMQEICEGESATLSVSNVRPLGTTVSWVADPTIVGTTDGDSITVKPVYSNGVSSKAIVNYTAVAYNRLCASEAQFIVPIQVDEPLSGVISGKKAICEKESAILNATDYNASIYSWSDGSDVISNSGKVTVNPSVTTVYTLEMERGKCKASDYFEVAVASIPTIVSVDSVGVRDRQVLVEMGKGTPPFEYWADENKEGASVEDILYGLSFTTHIAHVKDVNGCSASKSFVMNPPQISIPEYFSPNGDGLNDNWVVGSLADVYPEALVVIYDRFGKELIRFRGEDANGWDGTYNGVSMPSTDYWYVIDIEEIDVQYTGHFTLVRQ